MSSSRPSISLRVGGGRSIRPTISAPQPLQKPPSAASSTTTLNGPPSESPRRPSESSRRPSESSRRPSEASGRRSESSRRPSVASSRRPQADGSQNPRPRQRTADRTAEMVKRRYSTRFAQAPDLGLGSASTVPSVPPMTDIYTKVGGAAPGSAPEAQRTKVDVKVLRDPNFKPETYIAGVLQGASEAEIRAFKQELQKLKNRTSTDLQNNVFQNRTQFIKISKEAEGVKTEMRALRSLISDLTSTISATSVAAGTTPPDTAVSRRRSHRTSVANLEAMWNTHLQTLWKRVEGSQKYLPAVPGRHIVYESGKWVELNAATWKSKRRVHIILLNDHLLIAVEKRRTDQSHANEKQKQGPQSQALHVARYCWPLRDVSLADISTRGAGSGGGAPASAINIRIGADSFTYATSAGDTEKATLLATFRKTAEDLRKASEAENAERERIRGPGAAVEGETNFLAAREMMGGLLGRREGEMWLQSADAAGSLSLGININTMLEIEGAQHSLRSIEASLDDLAIAIALQHFDPAVEGLEKLRRLAKGIKGHAIAAERVDAAVEARATKLGAVLIRRLLERHSWEHSTKETVELLGRIGWEDRAREAYLGVRSETIRKRARQSPFTGNLPLYIHTLSFIYFTLIRNTLSLFHSCFSPSHASAVIGWAKIHVEEFNDILTRQMDSVDPNSEVYRDCLERAKKHADMLTEVGVDWRSLVGGELGESQAK